MVVIHHALYHLYAFGKKKKKCYTWEDFLNYLKDIQHDPAPSTCVVYGGDLFPCSHLNETDVCRSQWSELVVGHVASKNILGLKCNRFRIENQRRNLLQS